MPGMIGLEADTQEAQLSAGEQAAIQLTITNGGYVVDAFDLTVRGIDPSWCTIAPNRVSLFPHAKATATLMIQPPAQATAFAGDYAFEVVATSRDAPTDSVSIPMRLWVAAQGEVALGLEPQRIVARKGTFRLSVTNDSNKERPLVLRPSDPDEALVFAFGQATPTAISDLRTRPSSAPDGSPAQPDVATARPAGEIEFQDKTVETTWNPPSPDAGQGYLELTIPAASRVEIPLTVQPKKRIWFGAQNVPMRFNVLAAPPGVEWEEKDVRRVAGELIYRPILAAWAGLPRLLRLALIALIVLGLLALLLYLLLRPNETPTSVAASQTATALANSAAATQTAAAAAAQTAQAAAAQTATAQALLAGKNSSTQTAEALANSQTATAVARMTQTATAAGIHGPVEILTFDWVSPIDANDMITGSWQVTNALQVMLDGTPVPTAGTIVVDTKVDQSLVLTATDGINTVADNLGVLSVKAPRITSFTADPPQTCPGCSITLRWTTQLAARVLVDGTPVPDDQVPNGTIRVTPTQNTEYLLTAENAVGQVEQVVPVTVQAGLPTPTASP